MDFATFTQGVAKTSWTACATYAACGAAAGALAVPLLVLLAIKFN